MKYYGKKSVASSLKVMIDILLIVGAILFVVVCKEAVVNNFKKIHLIKMITTSFLFVGGGICLFGMLINLRRISNSLIDVNPFIKENVKRLKNISIESFIISLCYLINIIINYKTTKFQIVYIDARGIHTDFGFFIFFFAGCFIFILSKVFEQAVKVKEENDLTI